MRSRKPLAALVFTAFGTALVVAFKPAETVVATLPAATSQPVSTSTGASGSTDASDSSSGTGSGGSSSGSTAQGTLAGYADGTYAGSVVQEPWGSFQVQATISGGQLVDVTLVSAPGDGHSSSINSQAVPMLTEAAIAAQSADIDAISGATWTSRSYAVSLQAALDAASA